MFAAVSHTVMGYIISQKTKRLLDKLDIYIQPIVGNKTCKCLLSFVSDKAGPMVISITVLKYGGTYLIGVSNVSLFLSHQIHYKILWN